MNSPSEMPAENAELPESETAFHHGIPMPMPLSPIATIPFRAEQLNGSCRCASLNRKALRKSLADSMNGDALYRMLTEERPHLCADVPVFVSQSDLDRQAEIIAALERVIALPAFREQVLSRAPLSAAHQTQATGVFLGYDFHLGTDGPRLIEINSNAGGALINAQLIRAQDTCCEVADHRQPGHPPITPPAPEAAFVEMFLSEWRAERGIQALRTIAIVDEQPEQQYLYPEFLLFKQLFEAHGLQAWILDPSALEYRDGGVWHQQTRIDLIYNRLTDFGLDEPQHAALRATYLAGAAVVTPHPRNHALYADKRNLILLSDDDYLRTLGVDSQTRAVLREGVAKTIAVASENAAALWAERKRLFFKPARGYGSKAAYRGDKLTKRVFEDILQNDYVAQSIVLPSERRLDSGDLKLDLRHYVYRGETQLVCARLYQGQTTNFRTPGGGFAQVVAIAE
ncbi:hypothetical protein [Methylomonas sp. LWB]|uniref:hypothetical protein n=1 Tax=Methylomonas sp. LWB TaxID=1905845 RepID=UPI000AA10641|nr:hypothetical protein [Methylomonas sp. LWB]